MFYLTPEAHARSWILEAMTCEERGYHHLAEACRKIAEDILNG